MLELFKGSAIKSYENDFFRKLAFDIQKCFEDRNWNGLLLGMPESLLCEQLQIDCLLITNDHIIIIDFKKYKGDLYLPADASFEKGIWKISDTYVKGGSSINPYRQLKKQKKRLYNLLLKEKIPVDRKSITILVCFQNKVNINGEIPNRIVDFGIADCQTIINKIIDIVDVRKEGHEYLEFKDIFNGVIFKVPSYDLNHPIEKGLIYESAVEDIFHSNCKGKGYIENKTQLPLLDIKNFLKSDCRVLLINGNIKSGKTFLIEKIRDLCFSESYSDVEVLAYSNKLKKKIQIDHPGIDEIFSLYGRIFDFNEIYTDSDYKKIIPLKINDENSERQILIIDDSHLISNNNFSSDMLQFGSGHLLDDIIKYFNLKEYINRKIIFIGDKNRISYGSNIENAMNKEYYRIYSRDHGIKIGVKSLDLLPNEKSGLIVNTCNIISQDIKNNYFNYLSIDNSIINSNTPKSKQEVLQRVVDNPRESKMLVYKNKEATVLNRYIKRQILKNGNEVNRHDEIIFHSSVEGWDTDSSVDSGSLGTVNVVDNKNIRREKILVDNEYIELVFVPCKISIDFGEIKTYIFYNYLKSDTGEITINEKKAYKILLDRLQREYLESIGGFRNSPEYKEMERKQHQRKFENSEYYILDKDRGYRQADDQRKLTREEQQYRKRCQKELLQNRNTDFFKIYNAARIRYAWVLTVHRAISYSFNNIYLLTESKGESRSRNNKDYFRWLYTGISVANQEVKLLNWRMLTPFENTEFKELPYKCLSSKEIIYTFKDYSSSETIASELKIFLINRLQCHGWNIGDTISHNYLIIVKLEKNSESIELFFDYDKKGNVKIPRLKTGSLQAQKYYEEIKLKLKMENQKNIFYETHCLGNFIKEFNSLLLKDNISAHLALISDWNVIFRYNKLEEEVVVKIVYNIKGLISQYIYLEGSRDLFYKIVDTIKLYYYGDVKE